MQKLRTKQKGFTLVEGLLIILIVALLAFAGYYVWHSQKKKKDDKAASTSQIADTDDNQEPTPAEVDPTTGWTVYSNGAGKFALRTPAGWVQGANPQFCTEGTVLLGPTAATAGMCGTDGSAPQIVVSSQEGDMRDSYQLGSPYYTNVQKTSVTVSGVTGEKQTGTAQGQQDGEGIPGLPNDTQVTRYLFYTNGKTYAVTYNQLPTYSDISNDFNLMVTKTLQFN